MTLLAFFVLLGVLITVLGWRFISWQGHLGGFLAGAAAAAIIAFAPKAHRSLIQWTGLTLLMAGLAGLILVRAAALA
jgi:membrane associated rhomboid family serine protease